MIYQGKKIFTQVGWGQFFVARGGSAIYGLDLENFLLRMSNFSIFFPSAQKNIFEFGQKVTQSKTGQPLI